MLFSYTYVPHGMERMQGFIDFIFSEVWCKAPIGLDFSLDLFDGEPYLRDILSSFGFAAKAPERGKKFYKDIKKIYSLFSVFTSFQIGQLKQWYQANNDIEKVCANDPVVQIARYADIETINLELATQLASFFKGLYSQDLLDLAALKERIGHIDEHYKAFMEVNTTSKCPFCGLSDIKGVHHKKREAYDHYLPRALYPFNSINFHNLAPACHECNSTYKLQKDPARNATRRRKSFYPYAQAKRWVEISIDFNIADAERLEPDDITLAFGPAAIREEIETWKDLFAIEERYKAKCCSESDGKYWLTQVLDEWKNDGRTPEEYLRVLARQAKKFPFADGNFLRKPFLDGCQRAGMFSHFCAP